MQVLHTCVNLWRKKLGSEPSYLPNLQGETGLVTRADTGISYPLSLPALRAGHGIQIPAVGNQHDVGQASLWTLTSALESRGVYSSFPHELAHI